MIRLFYGAIFISFGLGILLRTLVGKVLGNGIVYIGLGFGLLIAFAFGNQTKKS